ncbi:2Fe-2S iron-sulfur cluster-binding protein [Alteromonas sp. A081]|uniref:2Fe-2S iron-sulfur cluster-binding protein n=1 Tax=Alteromonas sp. A081 TaxID=3410269 RepID=UPI003B9805F6
MVDGRDAIFLKMLPVNELAFGERSSHSTETIKKIELVWVLEHPYYHVISRQGLHAYQPRSSLLFDAVSGNRTSLTPAQISQIANSSYTGDSALSRPELIQPPFSDYAAQQNPMWKVSANDKNNTAIYLDSVTGQVIKHVNDDARLKALMFKLHFMDYGLHFMDYDSTGGFNHGLIITFAISALVLSVSGLILLVQRYQQGSFSLSIFSKKRSVSVLCANPLPFSDIHSHSSATVTVELDPKSSLFRGLIREGIYLPSLCDGAGTCGKCKFLANNHLAITPAEKASLPSSELEKGYRLACQHKCSEVSKICVITVGSSAGNNAGGSAGTSG